MRQKTKKFSKLSCSRGNLERLLGFRAGRFTNINSKFCGILSMMTTTGFYVILYRIPNNPYSAMFTQRGVTPYIMVLLAFWTLFILLLKTLKIRLQRSSLRIAILPREQNFVLSPNTVDLVLQNIRENVERPKEFFLFNRIIGTLANLKNIGRISDIGEILRTYNEQDIETVEISYAQLQGFLWAIPVLGFIGTVEGLSKAIGAFGKVLASSADVQTLTVSLQSVTGGLATAFETTLLALILALILHLLMTSTKKSEEELLIACTEYCSQNIISHLRMPEHRDEEQIV